MIKKAIILGRKEGAAKALRWLVEKGVKVPLVVVNPNEKGPYLTLAKAAETLGIPVYTDDESVYWMIENQTKDVHNIDLVISYLHNKKIRAPLFKLGAMGCINFHPAPLPDYKSSAGYNTAILDQKDHFGVSAHFIDSEQFDSGPIIKVLRFPINHADENAFSLEKKAQEKMFELFTETMDAFLKGRPVPTYPNSGGLYLTRSQLESLKTVDPQNDSPEEIDRKIRAFFVPPHTGAFIEIAGRSYMLLNGQVLSYLSQVLKEEND